MKNAYQVGRENVVGDWSHCYIWREMLKEEKTWSWFQFEDGTNSFSGDGSSGDSISVLRLPGNKEMETRCWFSPLVYNCCTWASETNWSSDFFSLAGFDSVSVIQFPISNVRGIRRRPEICCLFFFFYHFFSPVASVRSAPGKEWNVYHPLFFFFLFFFVYVFASFPPFSRSVRFFLFSYSSSSTSSR